MNLAEVLLILIVDASVFLAIVLMLRMPNRIESRRELPRIAPRSSRVA